MWALSNEKQDLMSSEEFDLLKNINHVPLTHGKSEFLPNEKFEL